MHMLVLILSIIILHEHFLCSAQELVEEEFDNNYDELGNCSDTTSCISQYSELESYILNNKNVAERITESFYRTGKGVTRFIRITYSFQTPNSINDTNDTIEDFDFNNCSNHQIRYIWSESPLYLLGPRALFWFTLFAVNIPEASVTIDLPCLCNDAYDNLLSRLTYLVKVYSAVKYDDHSLDFINRYYFKIKGKGSGNYEAVVSIMRVTVAFPLTLLVVFTHLVTKYIYRKLSALINKHLKEQSSRQSADDSYVENSNSELEKHQGLKISSVYIRALFLICFLLNLAFFAFHILSLVENIQYGNEILFNEDSEITSYDDHQAIPIWHAVLSLIPVAITLLYGTCIISCWVHFRIKNRDEETADITSIHSINGIGDIAGRCALNPMPAAELLAVNIIYIGSYFMPYMLLAFIHDPLQTSFVYLVVMAFILCAYLTGLALCGFFSDEIRGLYPLALSLATAASIVYFLVVIIYILSVANFHDFEAIQNLLLPLIIGLLSLLVFKPVYENLKTQTQYTKGNSSSNNEDNTNAIINPVSDNNEDSHNSSLDQNNHESTNDMDNDENVHCSEND